MAQHITGDPVGDIVGERWIIFGDSLSDNGLFAELANGFLTVPVPFQTPETHYSQSFTNGTVYADTWMALRGVSGENYINLALGGAQATGEKLVSNYIEEYSNLTATNGNTFSIVSNENPVITNTESVFYGAVLAEWDINLAGQVSRYLEYYDDDPTLYTTASIFIGANDLSKFEFNIFEYLFAGQVEAFAAEIVGSIDAAAQLLMADGVDRIVLNTLPMAQLFYAWEDASYLEREVGEDLIDTTTTAIIGLGSQLQGQGIDTEVVRIDQLSIDLNFDGDTFGFGTVQPYLLGYGGDPDWVETAPGSGIYEPVYTLNPHAGDWRLDQRLFYDEIHPTAALHDVLAVFTHASVAGNYHHGSYGWDDLQTGNDNDVVLSFDGADKIKLLLGDDVALGGRGNDQIDGNGGSDLLIGGGGNDLLRGGNKDDLLAGSAGMDELRGNKGNDILIGGQDGDLLRGGNGADHFIFVEDVLTAANDVNGGTIFGGSGFDTLWLVLSEATTLVLGTDGSDDDLAALGLTVNQVETVNVLSYGGLETLSFDADLGTRYAEAQLWGIV